MKSTGFWAAAFLIAALTAGCASHPSKIDCDGRLRPINLPAPKSTADASGGEVLPSGAVKGNHS